MPEKSWCASTRMLHFGNVWFVCIIGVFWGSRAMYKLVYGAWFFVYGYPPVHWEALCHVRIHDYVVISTLTITTSINQISCFSLVLMLRGTSKRYAQR